MRYIIILVILIISVSVANAQSDQCSTILQEAIAEANESCADMTGDTVCYGTGSVQVTLSPDSSNSSTFSNSADTLTIDNISQITTAPFNLETGEVGVAVINLPIELSDNQPPQSVVLILIGDAILENTGSADDTVPSFSLRRETASSSCPSVPNGLMIQSPPGIPFTFNMNGAEVSMGSTVFLTVGDNNQMAVRMLEGRAIVANQSVVAGFNTEIEIDPDTNQVTGEWSEVELFDNFDLAETEIFEMLDESYLNYALDVPDSDYLDEIADLLEQDDFDYDDLLEEYEDYADEEFEDEEFEDEE